MPYSVDYSGTTPVQNGTVEVKRESEGREIVRYERAPAQKIPSIVKSTATFIAAGLVFFGAERFAPVEFRPSTLMGTYDARVSSAVKAAEFTQQAKFDAWAGEVKISVEQQVDQYKVVNQAMLAHYQASYDRAKILADATARIQAQYVSARMAQTQATQSTDLSIVNLTRFFGRAANAVQPGSGASALAYADNLSNELSNDLTDAATQGVTISVEGWDTGLPSVADLQRDIDALKPIEIPAAPVLGEDSGKRVVNSDDQG